MFVNLGNEFGSTKELQLHPEGLADLIVSKANWGKSKKGADMLTCILDFDGGDYEAIFHHMVLPTEEDDARDSDEGREVGQTRKFKIRAIKRFLHSFGVEMGEEGFDDEAILGATGRVPIGQEDYEGNLRNVLKLPRAPRDA